MKFTKYDNLETFGADTLEILMENEVQNNLPISFIRNERGFDTSDWMLFTIKDDAGSVVLTAACTPPYSLVLYETSNRPNNTAIELLSNELKQMNYSFPGALAEQGLAQRFAEVHSGRGGFHTHVSMNIMRLDKVNDIERAPGFCRSLREEDLFYVPYWEYSFAVECQLQLSDIPTKYDIAAKRLGKDVHYIWEDGHPVSQVANLRNTENGGGISAVYTPPYYRGKGYASSVVAELSQMLLERGYKFCYLFADAENPISCGIYRKIGYYDLCVFDEIKFDK